MQAVSMALLLFAVADPPRTTGVNEAIERVRQIVNQPVRSYPRDANASVGFYSPGWFHEGALVPDFGTVDVRQTQQFPYDAHEWVTSDLNPGLMFRGRDLEFNSMTKHFYTDRSVPKKRLTEEQMVEINRLYRVIASSVVSTPRLPQPPRPATPATAVPVVSRAALAGGSVAVLLFVLALSMHRRRSGRER